MTVADGLFRPVQFLGSKLRSVDAILAAVNVDGFHVWDAFSGSSVVSQAFARAGATVSATDMLDSGVTFARAMLGVDRTAEHDLSSMADEILRAANVNEAGPWGRWLELEEEAVGARDGDALLELSRQLPQRWRLKGADPRLRSWLVHLEETATHSRDEGRAEVGFLTGAFAGTYFGLGQAIALESLRAQIEIRTAAGWVRDGLMTALCNAASAAVFSAGKHFAQPHKVDAAKVTSFHRQRIISDRSVDVLQQFRAAAAEVSKSSSLGTPRHQACRRAAEGVTADELAGQGVRVVYADPPYTAQQYSRFYHLLETLLEGRAVSLQRRRGQATSGLYPERRYLSPFCSRKQAPPAFGSLIASARGAGCDLALSYSATRTAAGTSGNARTVSLDELVQLVQERYGARKTVVTDLDVIYRQFNNAKAAVPKRREPEVLIVGSI